LGKKILSIVLIMTMVFSFAACGKKNSDISAKPEEKTIEISETEILKNFENSIGMWEFAQTFFDDMFIYKNEFGTWAYKDVDKSLPMNNYDWKNLRHAGVIDGTEWEYYEGTDLKSIKGIDISEYNKIDDWNKVKADGVEFVMVRAGYRGYSTGKFKEDAKFVENVQGAADADINVGVYFVTQAINVAEAIEEADWVIDRIKETYRVITYPIALDLEDTNSDKARTDNLSSAERTEIIRAFCDRLIERGYTPMLYSNVRWYLDEMDLADLTEYSKWFAQYFNKPFFPYEFQIWQYTSSGKVDGISGNVDLNLCMYDFANPPKDE